MADLKQLDGDGRLARLDESMWFNLIVGTFPYTGGVMAAISKKVQQTKEERLLSFLSELAQRVERLGEEKIDRTFLDTEEFYGLLEFVWTEVSKTNDTEKIEQLLAFFISSSSTEAPDVTLQGLFRHYLLNLSGSHLTVLRTIYRKQRHYSLRDRAHMNSPIPGEIPITLDDLKDLLPRYPWELTRAIAIDLVAFGLLGDWAVTHDETDVQSGFFITDNGLLFMNEIQKFRTEKQPDGKL